MQKRKNICSTLHQTVITAPCKKGYFVSGFLLFFSILFIVCSSSFAIDDATNSIWKQKEKTWTFQIKNDSNMSYLISENKEKNEIKLTLGCSEGTSLPTEQILQDRPDFINIACSKSDKSEVEYTFSIASDYSYNVQKGDTGLFIIFNPVKNYTSEIDKVALDIQSLINNPHKTETSNIDEKINSLDNSISKLRVENELKLAKQITPEFVIQEPKQVFAQDTTGAQSLSVGNVGNPDRKIEIREAEPVEPPSPPSPPVVENTNTQSQSETPQTPSEPPKEQQTEQAQAPQGTPAEEGAQPPMPRETTPEQAVDATAEITRELRKLQSTNEGTDKQLVPITPEEPKSTGKPAEAEKPKQEAPEEIKIKPSPKGLDTIIDFECEQMPLAKVVPLLAYKAGINVIAGADLKGNVTMSLKQVTLRRAIEAALRMNGLGIIQEENIYRIVPYEEALSSDRSTIVVRLENAKATEVRKVLEEISKGTKGREYITLSANDTTNVVIVSGPEESIQGLAQMARELDIAKPVIPTITTTIKLNYADPEDLAKSIQKILTPKTGNVSADARARNIIVTDIPVVVEQVKEIVQTLDVPVKQVLIDTMVVDATLGDESQTGIDWLLKSVHSQSWRDFVMYGPEGRKIGNIQQLDLGGASKTGDTIGSLTFNILTNEIDWKGVIKAQIQNRNGHLISNPVVATIENKPATITISQEIPYIDLSQTSQGGALTNTRFKQIGTVLEVTPRVTHDNHVIIDIKGKESTVVGEFNGVPIEDMRQVTSTLHINSGQTIFVGGLRKRNDSVTAQKLPILGDIPVLNVVFRSNQRKAQINELLIFLTCSVLEQELPELTDEQKKAYDDAKQAPMDADLGKYMGHDVLHPKEMATPPYKWKRVKKDQ